MAGRQVVFIQGGGAGAHDEWDVRLVASLARELGDAWEVRFPTMPQEDDPGYARWRAAIRDELARAEDDVVVVGHSVGGAILMGCLADGLAEPRLGGIVLVAAPFVGPGGWPGDEFALGGDLGVRLPPGVPVHVFHGQSDETVPTEHAALYVRAIPQAQLYLLPGRDHQLDDDLSEAARVISSIGSTARA